MDGLTMRSDGEMGLIGSRRPLRVLGIGGSMRLGSKSLGALESALALAREAGAETTLASVRDLALPVYDPSIGLDGQPESLRRLVDQVRAADAYVLASPTYHGTVSGAVKNVLDALNVLGRDMPRYLAGKPVGLVALGGPSAMNTLNALGHATRGMNGLTTTTVVTVPASAVDEDTGTVTDDAVQGRLALMIEELMLLGTALRERTAVAALAGTR